MEEIQKWFLMKRLDGSIFGPVEFQQLYQWAQEAQISAFDMVSTDEVQWSKAPMIPELEMDFIVEVGPDQYYGPTTLGALAEFMRAGEFTEDSLIVNCKTGQESQAKEFPELSRPEEAPQPVRASTRISLQKRVAQLEEALLEERQMRAHYEARCQQLQALLEEAGISE